MTIFGTITLILVINYLKLKYIHPCSLGCGGGGFKILSGIYPLALLIILLFFCLGALYTQPNEGKMDEKTTEPLSSTDIQFMGKQTQQLMAWMDKLIDNLNDKEDHKKITDLYDKIVLLTRDNERCSGQLKYCSDQLAAKQ